MEGITAAVIARDEERCIGRCLSSLLASDVDDVVLLDTGSTDRTVATAAELATDRLRIVRSTWRDSFADARNEALAAGANRTVVFLDADEWLEPPESRRLAAEVHRVREAGGYDALAPQIQESSTGEIFYGVTRIVLDSRETSFRGVVHEYPAVASGRARIGKLGLTVMHDGYSLGAATRATKARRNAELIGRELARTGGSARARYFALMERLDHADEQRILGAVEELRGAVDDPADPYPAEDYVRRGLIEAITHLIVIGAPTTALDLTGGLAEDTDAAYLRAMARIVKGEASHDVLRDVIIARRLGTGTTTSSICPDGRHLDAVIAFLIGVRGDEDRAARYRQASPAWTDPFFLNSMMRTA
ncbi:glycosyltransferase [Actinoplanes sp. NPDC049668]|uniref:glycosyltransferase n=1 Tax=unclassified Actinoplanes TaxID=2626549 RepID=UPI0033B991F6